MPNETEATISVNGGPAVPMSAVKEALDIMKEGHNSGKVAADQLRLFIERIERMEEEKRGIADDIKDTYAEAKANGYDVKAMREIVRLRKLETQARIERGAVLATYADALGMQLGFDL